MAKINRHVDKTEAEHLSTAWAPYELMCVDLALLSSYGFGSGLLIIIISFSVSETFILLIMSFFLLSCITLIIFHWSSTKTYRRSWCKLEDADGWFRLLEVYIWRIWFQIEANGTLRSSCYGILYRLAMVFLVQQFLRS